MEYGAPLVQAYIRQYPVDRASCLRQLQERQTEVLAWIYRGKESFANVKEGILGIPPISLRFEHLRTRFQLQFEFAFHQNPLRVLAEKSKWPEYINYLTTDTLFLEFRRTSP
jgi:hypothetical protein